MNERGPTRRVARARATVAAVVVAIATAAIPLVAGGAPVRPQLSLAVVATAMLLAGLAGWAPGLTVAALALGVEYALRLRAHHGIDALAIVEAVALFATVEAGMRALDARSVARPEPAVRAAARRQLVAMIAGAGGAAATVLVLGSRRLPAPTAALAVGLAAAASVLVAAELVRRTVTRAESPSR